MSTKLNSRNVLMFTYKDMVHFVYIIHCKQTVTLWQDFMFQVHIYSLRSQEFFLVTVTKCLVMRISSWPALYEKWHEITSVVIYKNLLDLTNNKGRVKNIDGGWDYLCYELWKIQHNAHFHSTYSIRTKSPTNTNTVIITNYFHLLYFHH